MKQLPAVILFLLLLPLTTRADEPLASRLSGRILLQIQSRGQAWYVDPLTLKRHYLGQPADAFTLMKGLALGVSNRDFDSWHGRAPKRLAGRIIIKPEDRGRCYYIEPTSRRLHYLGRPADAFALMRQLGLGISDRDLVLIPATALSSAGRNPSPSPLITPIPPSSKAETAGAALSLAAAAVRSGNTAAALKFFSPEISRRVKYSLDNFNADSRLAFANLLAAATESGGSETEKTFSAETYFDLGGYKVNLKFLIKKQPDGSWLIANL